MSKRLNKQVWIIVFFMFFINLVYFESFSTGCLYAKLDVLNCWCDLAFEFLVFWLSLVWSWVVEIYAWSTIWNFFDLRQPQQPQIKSVKIQSCFCSIFVKLFIDLSFYSEKIWLKICQEWQLTWYHQDLFGFTLIMQVFSTLFKSEFLSFSTFFFHKCSKN